MSSKTTIILTFIASVFVPFIRDLVDMIESVKAGFSSSNGSESIQREMEAVVSNFSKPAEDTRTVKPCNNPYQKDIPRGAFSRFLSGGK